MKKGHNMPEERVDYFDENYQKLGITTKPEARANGYWVHSFHCWILQTGEEPSLYFQKRSTTKALFPNFLDISAAGHLRTGEQVADGVREISEEVGLKVTVEELISLGVKFDVAKLPGIINRQFCHVFLYPTSVPISDLDLDNSELDGMVSIALRDGLSLFSGAANSVEVTGVEKDLDGKWRQITKVIGKADFIPRIDPYYYKMFINADLFTKGYKYLSI
jgi:isopentenyldiphosphate isomerase